METRVVIADDHHLVRAGIATLLKSIPELNLVGEASNGLETLKIVQELKPHLLLLDISMPQMSGLEVLERIKESQPEVKVIILSMHSNEAHIRRALELKAEGYLVKDVLPHELRYAIKGINAGKSWFSSAASVSIVDGYLKRNRASELTEKQYQVLKLIASGCTTKQISHELNLCVKTIGIYRAEIMEKLNIHDVAGLVHYAIRHGIIPL